MTKYYELIHPDETVQPVALSEHELMQWAKGRLFMEEHNMLYSRPSLSVQSVDEAIDHLEDDFEMSVNVLVREKDLIKEKGINGYDNN